MRIARVSIVTAAALALAVPLGAAAEARPEEALTLFRVLVGRTGAANGAPRVSVVEGPFVFLGKSPEEEAKDVLELMDRLKESYRLADVSVVGTSLVPLPRDGGVEVPTPGTTLGVRVNLLHADAATAAYAISIEKPGEKASEAKVVVARGERGLVGTRDGDRAPYVFLTIEPLPYGSGAIEAPAVVPKLVNKVAPTYPEEARKARLSGVVLLDVAIGVDGAVREVKPVRSEPMGLTEAAVAAVRQWRYEPARDAAGKAVEAKLTVTVSFMLDGGSPAPGK